MIVALVPVVVAAAILLSQALHDIDHNRLNNGVGKTGSKALSSTSSQLPAKAVNHRMRTAQRVKSKRLQHVGVAQKGTPDSEKTPSAKIAALQPSAKVVEKDDTTRAGTAVQNSPRASATSAAVRTVQELVAAATVVAEKVTESRSAPEQRAKADNHSGQSEMASTSGAKTTEAGQSSNADPLVAILIARPEIKSIANLQAKTVAIDAKHTASNGNVRTAIAAAGATEVQLSDGQTKAIDRVVGGEVPAAVVTLVSPEAADWFPEIAGYKIFRVPLGPSQSQTPR